MVLLDEQRRHVDVNGAYLKLVGYRATRSSAGRSGSSSSAVPS